MCVYIVSKQLETGEMLPIATRNNQQEAEELVVALQKYWPGVYSISSATTDAPEPLDKRCTILGRHPSFECLPQLTLRPGEPLAKFAELWQGVDMGNKDARRPEKKKPKQKKAVSPVAPTRRAAWEAPPKS